MKIIICKSLVPATPASRTTLLIFSVEVDSCDWRLRNFGMESSRGSVVGLHKSFFIGSFDCLSSVVSFWILQIFEKAYFERLSELAICRVCFFIPSLSLKISLTSEVSWEQTVPK
jgi:hypothetical protein